MRSILDTLRVATCPDCENGLVWNADGPVECKECGGSGVLPVDADGFGGNES